MLVVAQVVLQMPNSCFIVYVGSTADNLISVIDGSHDLGTTSLVVSIVAVVICFLVIGVATYYTRRELDRMINEEDGTISEVNMDDVSEAEKAV